MNDGLEFFMSLPPAMRESLKVLAQSEGSAISDVLVMAIAEKLARAEHSAWLRNVTTARGTLKEKLTRRHEVAPASSLTAQEAVPHSEDAKTHILLAEAEQERRRLALLFEDAPVFIAVLAGPEHRFEMVNQAYRELLGDRDFIGKRVVDCVPEIAGTVWMDHLDRVYRTGAPWVERGARLSIAPAAGQPLQDKYVDYTYKARRLPDGTTSGIIALGVDTSLVQEVLKSSGGVTFLLEP
ncbi:MAG: PAS domain-containing protein [Janthinobacterium lividum]